MAFPTGEGIERTGDTNDGGYGEREREGEGGRERGRERGERGREKERELGSSLRYSGRKQKRRGLIREERERRTDGRTAAERDGLRYRSTVKWG